MAKFSACFLLAELAAILSFAVEQNEEVWDIGFYPISHCRLRIRQILVLSEQTIFGFIYFKKMNFDHANTPSS